MKQLLMLFKSKQATIPWNSWGKLAGVLRVKPGNLLLENGGKVPLLDLPHQSQCKHLKTVNGGVIADDVEHRDGRHDAAVEVRLRAELLRDDLHLGTVIPMAGPVLLVLHKAVHHLAEKNVQPGPADAAEDGAHDADAEVDAVSSGGVL